MECIVYVLEYSAVQWSVWSVLECAAVCCSLLEHSTAFFFTSLHSITFYHTITHSFTSLFTIPHSYTLLHIPRNSATPYHPSPHSITSLFTIWYSINLLSTLPHSISVHPWPFKEAHDHLDHPESTQKWWYGLLIVLTLSPFFLGQFRWSQACSNGCISMQRSHDECTNSQPRSHFWDLSSKHKLFMRVSISLLIKQWQKTCVAMRLR